MLATTQRISPEAYLAQERQAESKSEYFAGQVFAMSGASEKHNLLVTNLAYLLVGHFKGKPCRVYNSDMRVKVKKSGLYTYPDVVVVCDKPQFEEEQYLDTLLNPQIIIEVLSDSTEAYDRGKKFEHYRKLSSLKEYVLVSQNSYLVEQYIKQENNRWLLIETNQLDAIMTLYSVDYQLLLMDIYDKVEF